MKARCWSIAIGADSRRLVTGSMDKTARLWDLTAQEPAVSPVILNGHEGELTDIAITPDGRWWSPEVSTRRPVSGTWQRPIHGGDQ